MVARVRRVARQRQVGHAGTLDPLATGVLVLVLGAATRLSQYLMAGEKVYCAEIALGATTVTDDAEAPLLTRADVDGITRDRIEIVLPRFLGEIEQVPPRYAAVRQGGQKLYQLARKGIEVEAEPRPVLIHSIDLLRWEPPRLRLLVRCGPGTYLRSLARDIGAALGVGGYLHGLCRTGSGPFTVDRATPLERLVDADAVRDALYGLDWALLDLPAIPLAGREERAIREGRPVRAEAAGGGTVRLYGPSGRLAALGECAGGVVRPLRVFPGAK